MLSACSRVSCQASSSTTKTSRRDPRSRSRRTMPTPSRYLTAPETAAGLTPRASLISAAVIRPSSSTRTAAKIRDGRRARPAEGRAPRSRSTKSARCSGVDTCSFYLFHKLLKQVYVEIVDAAVIEISRLTKSFGSTKALDELDLTVSRGEVHGFLGLNGAGKSTTIRVLLGLLRKDAGDVRLLGGDPWSEAATLHRRLAYVPGEVSLWPNLTGGQVIDLLGRLRGGLDEARRRELVERFELDPTKKGRGYSKGNRQKVALVAALASDVDLLVLDEPTSGLDPIMESVFQEYVERFRADGHTVLLSSHILAEVEQLCDRVTIIRSGRTVETGSLASLRHLTQITIEAETADG